MKNPLIDSFSLPPFSAICPEHIIPALRSVLDQCRATIEKITTQPEPLIWNNLCQPLEEIENKLDLIWTPIVHLNSVKSNAEFRKAYENGLALLSEYSTWVGHHKGLYKSYQNLRNGKYFTCLSTAQKKVVENTLRDFKLSGINITPEKKKRYGEIVKILSKLSSSYSNNVLDATMGWSKLITEKKILSGVPESFMSSFFEKAKEIKKEGWLLTLDIPSYHPVMTYCDNHALREELYCAYSTRASDQGPHANKWDNSVIMSEIITLRHELAEILGFKSYANQSLETKMAKNPKQVLDFLINLAKQTRKTGKKEIAQLKEFSKKYYNHENLNPWDINYFSEKEKQHLFSINDEQLRPYFPEKKVLSGLFEIVHRIYGITAKKRTDIETWHPEVQFFDILDYQGHLCGSFYLDLYFRDNKQSGAWMSDCRSMMRKMNGVLQKPVAYLTCNFNRPVGDKPALFTHNEVITLFHEFGHNLHHILTKIEIRSVSGISGVPWDAVELPSQLMENYCWQPDALVLISGHYKTGDPIPSELINKLLKSKNYQAAMFILRQIELCLFDFLIHLEFNPEKGSQILETLTKVKKQISVTPTIEWSRLPHTFSHIFAGSYAAGYYSYLWANVLSADVWLKFKEEGIFNRTTGRSFLENILSRGGSEDPTILFMRFRGRKPKLEPMLYDYGIEKKHGDFSYSYE